MPGVRRLPVLLIALALLTGGCGGEDDTATAEPSPAAEAPAAATGAASMGGHVHGLAVDPDDGALLIATHTGLYRAPEGSTDATRVGEDASDLMGFTVTESGDYLSSGHPAEGAGGPPSLGLQRSTDEGRTWTPVSLAGQADFHALRASGRHVYGADSMTGTLYASDDRGRTWQRRRAPAPPIDLAIHPGRPQELLATTEAGLARSADGGRTWRPVTDAQIGLLAWPEGDRVLLLDAAGRVIVAADGGTGWTDAGQVGGRPVAFMVDGDDVYVALEDGAINRSRDGGVSWQLRARV